MARKRERKPAPPPPPRGTSDRERAIDALMTLLGEQSIEQIGLAEVAGRAGLKLSQLRAEFGSVLAILAAHIKDVDRWVLARGEGEATEESPRERLFEVLMRRIDTLAPYKAAVRSLLSSARRRPSLALALNALAIRSQRWMLEAAGISAAGPRGAMRAQGSAMLFGRVIDVWVDEENESLDRTMAALDRGLARAERWSGFLDDLCALPACILRGRPHGRRRPYDEGAAEADAA